MLMRYKAWANGKMFDAMAALPAGEVMKERVSLFKNMVNTMGHLYAVDLVWKGPLNGAPGPGHAHPRPVPRRSKIAEWLGGLVELPLKGRFLSSRVINRRQRNNSQIGKHAGTDR